jgi:putative tryptophan/tyrosine transport system substrate-binding protein
VNRRRFLGALSASLLAAPVVAEAQPAVKIARIGWLADNLAATSHLREAFLQAMRDLGYVEDRNLVIEHRYAEGLTERRPALAAELVALKVDVIVSVGTPSAVAAKQATRTLPIVFAGVGDPVASGLVTSLARPGSNVTGLSLFITPKLQGKRLELLKQAVPGVNRVAILWQPGAVSESTEKDILKESEIAARALGVRLQSVEVRGPADFDGAFTHMTGARADALTVYGSAMFFDERRRLVDLAAKSRMPAAYGLREYVDAGGLMSYGPHSPDLYRRAAAYVDKILKGAKPADLPVEQPTKFELVINLKTARALGLSIPQSLLQRADRIIE